MNQDKLLLKSMQSYFFNRVLSRIRFEYTKAQIRQQFKDEDILGKNSLDREYYVFFAPEAGVHPHYAALCILARTLKEQGHKVLFTRCLSLFPQCPVKDIYSLPFTISRGRFDQTCYSCGQDSLEMLRKYSLESLDLRSLFTKEIHKRIHTLLKNTPPDLRNFNYDSVPFGKFASMNLVLREKIANFDSLPKHAQFGWLKYIENALISYFLTEELLKNIKVKSFIFYADYAIFLGVRMAAQKAGIPAYTTAHLYHLSTDRRRVFISQVPQCISYQENKKKWKDFRELALPRETVQEIATDSLFLFKSQGGHIFSPRKGKDILPLYEKLNISKERKTVVAFTSSLDEKIAITMTYEGYSYALSHQEQPFINQIEWLQSLIDYVESRDSLQLLVRIHPREGTVFNANRHKVESEHLKLLRMHFGGTYNQCRFIWPDDPISSYDLAEMADLALISWSTIGIELARLGIPVLASELTIGDYPNDCFLCFEPTKDQYFKKLEQMVGERSTSLDTIKLAYRWYHLSKLARTIPIDDVVPSPSHYTLPPFVFPRNAPMIEKVLVDGAEITSLWHDSLKKQQNQNLIELEHACLKQQLNRIIHYIVTGEDSDISGPKEITTEMEINGKWLKYRWAGKEYTRFSPLCSFLANLINLSETQLKKAL